MPHAGPKATELPRYFKSQSLNSKQPEIIGQPVQADLQIVVENNEGISRVLKKRCKEVYGVIKTCQQEQIQFVSAYSFQQTFHRTVSLAI